MTLDVDKSVGRTIELHIYSGSREYGPQQLFWANSNKLQILSVTVRLQNRSQELSIQTV